MKKIKLLLFVCISLVFALNAFGEKESKNTFTTGKVIKISQKRLLLSVFDDEKNKDVEKDFVISPKVKLRQVKKIKDIRKGDNIEIMYNKQKGKPTVIMIYLDRE